MKIPRDLSGREIVKVLVRDWDYRKIHQEGSHIILETATPSHQRLPVPDHKAVRIEPSTAFFVWSPRIRAWIKELYSRLFEKNFESE